MPTKAYKVLVVDDDRFLLSLVRQTLQDQYEVSVVSRGPEAIAMARVMRFDLILLDASMPDMDGFEVLERLQSHPALRLIPVLMLTALRSAGDVRRATQAGAIGYITKPFRPGELLLRVARVFERQAAANACRKILYI
jgi:DNA-binding response OmpR family regulator